MNQPIAVVGGSCVDIFAASAKPLVFHDSNPGSVRIGFGGVGRNIAENLARFGQDVRLIAAFGGDPFSMRMLEYTTSAGVNTEHVLVSPDSQAPFYISVNDSDADMAVAVNDMQICELITPGFLAEKLPVLNVCVAVIVDTNIPAPSIAFLAENCLAPLYAEAVSTAKAMKLLQVLPRLSALKVNRMEAEALLGTRVGDDSASLQAAANRFHAQGIPRVLITLGAKGAFLSFRGEQWLLPAFPVKPVNTNGCGDAFGAAAFLGFLRGDSPETVLRSALAAAALTAQSPQAVSPYIGCAAITEFLSNVRKPQ